MFQLTTIEEENLQRMIDHWQKEKKYYEQIQFKAEKQIEECQENIDSIRTAVVDRKLVLESQDIRDIEKHLF